MMIIWLSALATVAAVLASVAPAETISVTLLLLAVIAGAVAWVYRRHLTGPVPRSASQWLLLGIASGFLGTALVSTAWAAPWGLDAIGGHDLAEAARQLSAPVSTAGRALIIWAGVCHLVAAQRAAERHTRRAMRVGIMAAVAGVAILTAALLGMAAWRSP